MKGSGSVRLAGFTGVPGIGIRVLLVPVAGIRLEVAEPGPDLVGERMREPVEDGDGLAPGRRGGLGVALGQQRVAEPGQRVAFAERRADLAVGLDGLGVVRLGLGDVTQVQVDVADAVQGVGGPAAVAGIAVQGKRPLAVGQRLVVLAQVGVEPSDAILQVGLGPPVSYGLEHPQRVQRHGQRLGVALLLLQHAGQAVEHHGLIGPVTKFPEHVQRLAGSSSPPPRSRPYAPAR